MRKTLFILFLSLITTNLLADYTPQGRLLFREDFGGNDSADARISQQPVESMSEEYRQVDTDSWPTMAPNKYLVTKSGYCNGDTSVNNPKGEGARFSQWFIQDDHTYENDYQRGYLLEIDGHSINPDVFYSVKLNDICVGTRLAFSAWAVNVMTAFTVKKLEDDNTYVTFPNLLFAIYDDEQDTIIAQTATGFLPCDTIGNVDSTLNLWNKSAQWHQYGFDFLVPEGVSALRMSILNNTGASVGNDFALDDIEIYLVAPPVQIQADELACPDKSFTLQSDFQNDGTFAEPLEYQWYYSATMKDNSDPSQWSKLAQTKDLVIDNVTAQDSGYYMLQVAGNEAINYLNCSSLSEIHHLKVSQPSTEIVGTIELPWQGTYNGQVFYSDTVVNDTLTNVCGLDSILQTIIKVGEKPHYDYVSCSVFFDTLICGDTLLQFQLTLNLGVPDSVCFSINGQSFTYLPTSETKQLGYVPILLPKGISTVRVSVYNLGESVFSEKQIDVRYPAGVMLQKWNDYIGVLTHDFNGGYNFTAFQWYKNDSLMQGETESFIYQTLEVGAEYSVLLTDDAGNTAMTCPLIAQHKTDSTKYPVVTSSRNRIKVALYQTALINVFDAQGRLMYVQRGTIGENMLDMLFQRGLYLVAIYDENHQKPIMTKILVQ